MPKVGSVIYYTDNKIWEPICTTVRELILAANLPIVSSSLAPIDFGKNLVINQEPGILTYTQQILSALESSEPGPIFFCEHDVLYHPSHFEFTPPRDDTFYYNVNVWKWYYPTNYFVTYEWVRSLSGLCADRDLAIEAYKRRVDFIRQNGWRTMYGFEPGNSRISPAKSKDWQSREPNIDIRHAGTITPRKCHKTSFNNPPDWRTWRVATFDTVPGWNKEVFEKLCTT